MHRTLIEWLGEYWQKFGCEPTFWPVTRREKEQWFQDIGYLLTYHLPAASLGEEDTLRGIGFWIVPSELDGTTARRRILEWTLPMPKDTRVLDGWLENFPSVRMMCGEILQPRLNVRA